MSSAKLSTKGQLVIPARIRKALSLRAGDQVDMKVEGHKLILQRVAPPAAKLKRGRFGRLVLVAAKGAPRITTASVLAALEEVP
jgi:AbrB family looped-hinge helix DNA binding protein